MENALLVGLSRQMALRRELDIIANNLANANTSGFKAEGVLLEPAALPHARHDAFAGLDRTVAFVQDWGSLRDLTQGALQRTAAELDVAISGEGYLAVETSRGERYSREGSLQRNAEGELVTARGLRVLGEGGPIRLEENDTGISIAADGTVSASGGQRGKLRLVAFANPQALRQEGDGLYASDTPALPAESARFIQGALESSNVQSVGEMTRMIEVTRAYQTLSNLMQRTDELRRQAIDELGQVQA